MPTCVGIDTNHNKNPANQRKNTHKYEPIVQNHGQRYAKYYTDTIIASIQRVLTACNPCLNEERTMFINKEHFYFFKHINKHDHNLSATFDEQEMHK